MNFRGNLHNVGFGPALDVRIVVLFRENEPAELHLGTIAAGDVRALLVPDQLSSSRPTPERLMLPVFPDVKIRATDEPIAVSLTYETIFARNGLRRTRSEPGQSGRRKNRPFGRRATRRSGVYTTRSRTSRSTSNQNSEIAGDLDLSRASNEVTADKAPDAADTGRTQHATRSRQHFIRDASDRRQPLNREPAADRPKWPAAGSNIP